MLEELAIKNFAIIDDLQIVFQDGLTVLTGETGAGKSIIINAVNLLLGSRATAKLIRTGADNAELEARFEVRPATPVAAMMAEHGYDPAEGLLIRRIIARNERHRIFINGRMATIQVLSKIAAQLASISGQHAHQLLLREDQQLQILDQFGGLLPLRQQVEEAYGQILPLIERLKQLKTAAEKQDERADLLGFQRKEILDARLQPGEDDELEHEIARLRHAEALLLAVHGSIEQLYSSQNAVLANLVEIKKRLEAASRMDSALSPRAQAAADAAFQIEDLVEELRAYARSVQVDERRLEAAEARRDTLNRLKRKYGGSLVAVEAHLRKIEDDLSGLENLSLDIRETERRLAAHKENLVALACDLSRQRAEAAEELAARVENELGSLKMAATRLTISLESTSADARMENYLSWQGRAIGPSGMDRVCFLLAPNVGEELKPLAAIASGGELSRVVLALKVILARNESVETVIFDEVDAGIGGGVAETVGRKLAALAAYHQVLCITHLPQIARFGRHHYRISKRVAHGRTATLIDPLAPEDRLQEMARMLGGETITRVTLDHAKEMLTDAPEL